MQQAPHWLTKLTQQTTERLAQLVGVPSFSKEEEHAASLFGQWMLLDGIACRREGNNVWAANAYFDSSKPTILLNSHTDTVKPAGYTRDPFSAIEEDGRLYGLGTTDAGGALLTLYAVFRLFYHETTLSHNLVFAATAEEEISGANGIASVLPLIGPVDFAIVGEPTRMQMAVAEKGLLVLDCTARGKAGHAARGDGDNALYKALDDIQWFRTFRFPRVSQTLGEVNMNVTMIEAGTQHNVIPAKCRFTVDIRPTDAYTHEELLEKIRKHVKSEVVNRSLRLRPSGIDPHHPLLQAAGRLGIPMFGSPTLSDQALMPFSSVKIGPGDSARSHQADEFILLSEIREGLLIYHQLLTELLRT